MKILILFLLLGTGGTAMADSFIRVINYSSEEVQALWQAGGCDGVTDDWNNDTQYTLCKERIVKPGTEARYNFSLLMADRSVKVLKHGGQRIGYCNSMDYASVTIEDAADGGLKVETHCP